jgi:hypothetical protein
MRAAFVIIGLTVVAAASAARAEDDPACAQYEDPIAYNACLAKHGPKANAVSGQPRHATEGRPGEAKRSGEAKSESAGERRRDATGPTRRHGRVHMEIPID